MKRRLDNDINLNANEMKFRTFYENCIDAIMITSQDGRVYSANPAACIMLGMDEMEICRSGRNGIVEDNYELANALKRRKLTGRFFGELIFIKKDGTRFPVELTSSVFSDSDGDEFTALIIRDITERKKTEAALRESEGRFRESELYTRTLIEASIDPLVTINAEGQITDVNISTEKITGITRDKLIGSEFAAYFADPSKARKGYKIVFANGIVRDYPLTIRHISGREIDVLYNATIFRNMKGDVQGVFAAARDITDRKRMETELRNSKELLEKLYQNLQDVRENERSEIAMNLHDDLGQKLTAINLDIAWLKNRIGIQSSVVMNKFADLNAMINETIDGIKEIASILRPSILYDLGLVPAFEWQLKRMRKSSEVQIKFIHSPGEIKIDDHISLILFRVLQESLTNIVRHSGASQVLINLNKTKDTVELLISDNGKGFEISKIQSLTSTGIKGIQERVMSVSGKVKFRSVKSKGTFISVTIPLRRN